MKSKKQLISGSAAACAMLIIILDTKTAISGAQDGLNLCIQAVIPSLFPFLIFSGIIISCIQGSKSRFLRPLGRLCKIPQGSEPLLIIGLIAGYPVGAQLICESFKKGSISEKTAKRMLGFCNNAGPAFLFGMIAPQFSNPAIPWVLWLIHLVTAILVGCIMPGRQSEQCCISDSSTLTLVQSLQITVRTMAGICGWVILFRIILAFLNRWLFWMFDTDMQVLLSGLLELSNGCIRLKDVAKEGVRFLLASFMLAAGGLCVGMQTASVTQPLGTGLYFPGKTLQCMLAVSLSCFVEPLLFSAQEALLLSPAAFYMLITATAIHVYFLRKRTGIYDRITV